MFADALVTTIDRAIDAQIKAHHLPGLAMAILKDGELALSRTIGLANLEWPAPVTKATRFQLASVTKLFTAVLLMRLVEEKALSLDQSITDHLEGAPASWRPITIRHLANHTSGLPTGMAAGGIVPELMTPQIKTPQDIARFAAELPLAHAPGEASEYGLLDYALLTAVMEQAASAKYAELLARRLAGPLNLSVVFDNAVDRGMSRVADVIPQRASTYMWDGAQQRRMEVIYPRWSYSAGGLYGSLDDLVAFMAALDRGVLMPESLGAMFASSEVSGAPPAPFALGWIPGEVLGRATVGHSGGPALADVLLAPGERLSVIVLCNQFAMPPQIAREVMTILLEAAA
ncbi:serine hydrolase domain-containing protein [Phenylobacterium koreense]|uniref:CubicO group peptidase (Beta-lactamase class C family) n=1 Tax=Phenylobacterium koreense TaxID=266125 RepID=A0ABV2EJN7_9CAUL